MKEKEKIQLEIIIPGEDKIYVKGKKMTLSNI